MTDTARLNPTAPLPGWPTDPDQTAAFPPGHPDAPPTPVGPAPDGMVWALAPNGQRVLAYLPQPAEHTPPAAAVSQDPWPKRMLAGGGAISAVTAAVGFAGPGLSQAGHAVQMAGIGVGIAAASTGALVLLVKGGMSRQAGQNVSVSVNVTNAAHGGSASASSRGSRR